MSQAESVALAPISSNVMHDEVARTIRDGIWRGELKPGDRLNEIELAGRLGVSRPPLREAIRVLQGEGLTVTTPRRGTFVATLTSHDIFEIYTARSGIEAMAARMLMRYGPADAWQTLERRLESMEEQQPAGLQAVMAHDLAFHRTLMELAGNSRLLLMWDRLFGQLRLALTMVDASWFQDRFIEATHRPLVEAIRQERPEDVQAYIEGLMEVAEDLQRRWEASASQQQLNPVV